MKSQQETNDRRAALGIMAEARSRGRVLSHDPGQTRRFSCANWGCVSRTQARRMTLRCPAQLGRPVTLRSEGAVPLPTSDFTSLILIHFCGCFPVKL